MPSKTIKVPDYTASPRQTKFHMSEAFETMYGGAAGGGKTAAIVAEAVTYCMKWPKARVYIFRKTIPELKQSVIPEIYKQCADYINEAKGMRYNSQDRTFVFNNGSIIQLAYLENPADMYRYQSAEMHLLIIDELTHFTEDEYQYLKTRVRSTGEHPLKVMSATNPGNVGHAWVKKYFIDIAPPEEIYTDRNGNTRIFIPAKVSDHPSPEFVKTYTKVLEANNDPNLRRALLEGDWDVFAGQAFEEWRRDDEDGNPYHVVVPFEIPKHWIKWFAYDWGYNSFAAGVWLTKDPSTERIYVYREFYEHAMTASAQAETIIMLDDEGIRMRLADPSLWKQIGNAETGQTVAAIFEKNGIYFTPANNDRKAGKNAVHEALAPKADGLPGLQVFSSCVNFIRTVPTIPIDINRIEDVMTKGVEDHLYDAVRYGLMNQRPATFPEAKIPQDILDKRMRYSH